MLDSNSGRTLWTHQGKAAFAANKGILWAADYQYDGDDVQNENQVYTDIHVLDAQTGDVKRTFELGRLQATPDHVSTSDGRAACKAGGQFVLLDDDGRETAFASPRPEMYGSVMLSECGLIAAEKLNLYNGSVYGHPEMDQLSYKDVEKLTQQYESTPSLWYNRLWISCFDPQSTELLWEHEFVQPYPVFSDPYLSYADGRVLLSYVVAGSVDKPRVFLFDGASGQILYSSDEHQEQLPDWYRITVDRGKAYVIEEEFIKSRDVLTLHALDIGTGTLTPLLGSNEELILNELFLHEYDILHRTKRNNAT